MHLKLLLLLLLTLPLLATANTTTDWTRFQHLGNVEAPTLAAQAKQLTEGYDNDRDKAAALYYWVTHNIAYDVQHARRVMRQGSSNGKLYTAEEIKTLHESRVQSAWKKRRGVCENYARLYQRLAELAGLESVMVTGHARGDYLQPGSSNIGHAWNAVKIDGWWQLLDATWGAGNVGADWQFNQEFEGGYFLPDAQRFVLSHLPNDAKWQLLNQPITRTSWERYPAIGPGFFDHQVADLSHATYLLRHPRPRPLVLQGTGAGFPQQFVAVNFTTGQQLPASWNVTGDRWTLTIPAEAVKNMKLGLLTPDSDVVLAYEVKLTR